MCEDCKCGEQNCACDCNEACCNSDETMVPYNYAEDQRKTIDKLQRQLNDVYKKISHNVINELNSLSEISDSYYVEKLKRELEYTKHDANSRYTQNIIALMMLIELMEENITSGCGYKATDVVNNIIGNKPITPLTFEDDEFSNIPFDTDYQNIRNSRVFKDFKTGKITAVGALKCNTVATVDISRTELKVDEAIYVYNIHSGGFFVYDTLEKKWYYANSCHEINLKSDFIDEKYEVPVIELYDSNDKRNDYYAFIADYNDIPKDFFFYFNFTPLAVKTVENQSILKWLEDHHAEELLWKKREPLDYGISVEYADDSISVHYRYTKFLKVLEMLLRSHKISFNYAKISHLFTQNEQIIVLKNDPVIKELIELYIDPNKK